MQVRPRLLVVEDDPEQLEALAGLLEGVGFEVVTAGGLLEARRRLASHPPDVVITDFELTDGFASELVAETAGALPPQRIVVVTGYDLTRLPPAVKVFRKPLDFDALVAHLSSILLAMALAVLINVAPAREGASTRRERADASTPRRSPALTTARSAVSSPSSGPARGPSRQ